MTIVLRKKKFDVAHQIEWMASGKFSRDNYYMTRAACWDCSWKKSSSKDWFEFVQFEERRMSDENKKTQIGNQGSEKKENRIWINIIEMHIYVSLEIPEAFLAACQLIMEGKLSEKQIAMIDAIKGIIEVFLKFPKDHPQIQVLTSKLQALLCFLMTFPDDLKDRRRINEVIEILVNIMVMLISKDESWIAFKAFEEAYFKKPSLPGNVKKDVAPIIREYLIPSLHRKNQLANEKICRDWLEANGMGRTHIPANLEYEKPLQVYSPIGKRESTDIYFKFAKMYNNFVEDLAQGKFIPATSVLQKMVKYLKTSNLSKEEMLPIYNAFYRLIILMFHTSAMPLDQFKIIVDLVGGVQLLNDGESDRLLSFDFEEWGFYREQKQMMKETQPYSLDGLKEDQIRQYRKFQRIFNFDLKFFRELIPLIRSEDCRNLGIDVFKQLNQILKEIGCDSPYPQMSLVTRDIYQVVRDYFQELIKNFHHTPHEQLLALLNEFAINILTPVLSIQKNDCHQGVKDIAFVQNHSLLSMCVLSTNFYSFFKQMVSGNQVPRGFFSIENGKGGVEVWLRETMEKLQREEGVFACIEGEEIRSQVLRQMAILMDTKLSNPLDQKSKITAKFLGEGWSLAFYEICVGVEFFQVAGHDRRSLERSMVKVIDHYLQTLPEKERSELVEKLKKLFCESNGLEWARNSGKTLKELMAEASDARTGK